MFDAGFRRTLQRIVVIWAPDIGLIVVLSSILAVAVCIKVIGEDLVSKKT